MVKISIVRDDALARSFERSKILWRDEPYEIAYQEDRKEFCTFIIENKKSSIKFFRRGIRYLRKELKFLIQNMEDRNENLLLLDEDDHECILFVRSDNHELFKILYEKAGLQEMLFISKRDKVIENFQNVCLQIEDLESRK